MPAEIAIDPNLRVENNETVALHSDIISGTQDELFAGASVMVVERESGLIGWGAITHITPEYLQLYVDWKSLHYRELTAM